MIQAARIAIVTVTIRIQKTRKLRKVCWQFICRRLQIDDPDISLQMTMRLYTPNCQEELLGDLRKGTASVLMELFCDFASEHLKLPYSIDQLSVDYLW